MITKYLQSFIESEFIMNRSPFSIKTKRILLPLIKDILQSKKHNIQIIQNHISLFPKSKKSFPILHKEMQHYLENIPFFAEEFLFQLQQRKYRVICVFPTTNKKVSNANITLFFKKCVKQIIGWLTVCEKYATNDACSQEMDIYMYFTDHLKILPPSKYSPIGIKYVNTAFTTSCQPKTEIILFREEEWFKVFIHETFHNMGLDFSFIGTNGLQKQIASMFSISSDIKLFETYCEIWAETIYSIFHVIYKEEEQKIERIIKKMETIWKYEKLFSLFQTVKVLHHFGLSYSNIVSSKRKNDAYMEETDVFAYYIFKSIGIFYLEDFIEWCHENNTNILSFTKNTKKINDFLFFFKERYNQPEYIESIKQIEEWFSTQSSDEDNFEMKTMRMTVFA